MLNNHTLAEFLENPTKVIEESPSYRSMASYAEEKEIELDQLKKQMGDYELEQCEIQDKIYFLKTSKTGSTSIANILTRFGIRNGIRILVQGSTDRVNCHGSQGPTIGLVPLIPVLVIRVQIEPFSIILERFNLDRILDTRDCSE